MSVKDVGVIILSGFLTGGFVVYFVFTGSEDVLKEFSIFHYGLSILHRVLEGVDVYLILIYPARSFLKGRRQKRVKRE